MRAIKRYFGLRFSHARENGPVQEAVGPGTRHPRAKTHLTSTELLFLYTGTVGL